MSDSEDDFVEVDGYQSCDSDGWEKISAGYSSSEDDIEASTPKPNNWTKELVSSYYSPSQSVNKQDDQGVPNSQNVNTNTKTNVLIRRSSDEDVYKQMYIREPQKPTTVHKEKKKKSYWTKVSLKSGVGAPYDPVEFLGITSDDKMILNQFSITTIGQLAYCNVTPADFGVNPEQYGTMLDLQERAYQTVSEYITKMSAQPEIVWGYVYMGDKVFKNMLERGYLETDSLCFSWTPMPTVMYRDQLVIDNLMGAETKDKLLRNRYSRFVKINLTKLCQDYYGRLFQKEPVSQTKWLSLTLLEAAELAQREDLWYSFEPGNDIFSRILHGSMVVPTGRIPKDCIELDKENCAFASSRRRGDDSDAEYEDARDEPNATVDANLDLYI